MNTPAQNAANQSTNNGAAVAAAAADTKRARRSPDEARAARIAREENLAKKAKERAERLAAQAKQAEERARIALERKQAIEQNKPVVREKVEVPTIKENVQKRVERELKQALKEIGQKNGVNFDEMTPRLTNRGQALSVRLVAHVAGAVKSASARVKKAVGATREAARFIEHHKLVGIKPSLLGKDVQLANEEGSFKVMGLKGRAHDVVLQKVGTDEIKTIAADEFKTRMVMA